MKTQGLGNQGGHASSQVKDQVNPGRKWMNMSKRGAWDSGWWLSFTSGEC